MTHDEYLVTVDRVIKQYIDGAITLDEVINWIIANYVA